MKPFSPSRALQHARLSEIAYGDKDLAVKVKALGFDLVKQLGRAGGLSGFICKNAECAVLVFQGTDPREWETVRADLKFWYKKSYRVRYVAGFLEAYEKLRPDFAGLDDFVASCRIPLYITGHSLGGAIALITALRMRKFEACYTFGAPRVCTLSGEKHDDNKAIFRVIHENDIVPSLLPVFLGYWPFLGQLVYITAGNKIVTGWTAYVHRVVGQAMPIVKKSVFGIAGYVTNHPISAYIKALEIIAARA